MHKCDFVNDHAKFCGRVISQDGWKYDQLYFDKILLTPKPTYIWQLSQLLFLTNWLSPSVPHLAELKGPFSDILSPQVPLRTQRKDNTEINWTEPLTAAWNGLLTELNEASKRFLSQYSEDMPLCVFTDASSSYWGLMLTQCENNDPSKIESRLPIQDQVHRPLFFLSGKFSASQL